LDHQMLISNRRETRRHVSLEALSLTGGLPMSDMDIQAEHEAAEQFAEIYAAIKKLPPTQQELLGAILAGTSSAEYARKKGVNKSTVSRLFARARKNLLEILR